VADAAPASRAAEDIRQLAHAIAALLPAETTMPPPAPPRAAMPWTAPEWGTR
ncbi:cellulose synthase operon protein YhjQ, partial [Roseomonas ludipueritiae]|nr:cellulose synthase operon protein YhjQ [Pseudoroseomonas ludipueritiae]